MNDDLSKYGRKMTENEKVRVKPINHFPNYVVTSDGKIFSKERTVIKKNGVRMTYHSKEIRPTDNGTGYKSVMLYNTKRKVRVYVHRIVAKAFIPNPQKLPQINHKDENRANTAADNLEWCTCRYNLMYGSHQEKVIKRNSIPVVQLTLNDEFVAEYPSAMAAMRATGIKQGTISRVIQGIGRTAGGYKWKSKQEAC